MGVPQILFIWVLVLVTYHQATSFRFPTGTSFLFRSSAPKIRMAKHTPEKNAGVMVHNLPSRVDPVQFKEFMSKMGSVVHVDYKDKVTAGGVLKMATVVFSSAAEAKSAMEHLSTQKFKGRLLRTAFIAPSTKLASSIPRGPVFDAFPAETEIREVKQPPKKQFARREETRPAVSQFPDRGVKRLSSSDLTRPSSHGPAISRAYPGGPILRMKRIIVIENLPETYFWQSLKDLFKQLDEADLSFISNEIARADVIPGLRVGTKRGLIEFKNEQENIHEIVRKLRRLEIKEGPFHFRTMKHEGEFQELTADTDRGARIYVANLPQEVAWQDVKDYFSAVGPVAKAHIRTNPETGIVSGVVSFAKKSDALMAVEKLSGSLFAGVRISVRLYQE